MSRSSLLVVLALALMASFNAVMVSAQCTGGTQQCQTLDASSSNQGNSVAASLTLTFEDVGLTTAGPICSLTTDSTISNTIPESITNFPVIFSTPITLATCPPSVANGGQVTASGPTSSSYITQIALCFTSSLSATVTGVIQGTISPNLAVTPPWDSLLTITYEPLTHQAGPLSLSVVNQDICLAEVNADPHFKGFYGQSFFVGGEVGGVMNLLSTSVLQLNARVVFLSEGESMTAAEMARARRFAEIFHAKSRSAPLLPYTRGWEEEGNYMGELGIAMIGGHRLYAQPGSYQAGWNTVTLDGVDILPQSSQVVGDIVINRTSTHKIEVHTPLVDFTLVNSDNFFNIENAHLEDGWKAQKGYAGVLGQTADASFQPHVGDKEWQQKIEDEAMVPTNDLFAFSSHARKQ